MIYDMDPDLGMATQPINILKLLSDPENMLAINHTSLHQKSHQ